jgi:hypothetical protein
MPGGTALENVDYRPVNTTLTFAAGSRQVTCRIPVVDDGLIDGARTVNLALAIPPGGSGLLGTPSTAVLTVQDNDTGGTIRFGATKYTVTESATGSLTVVRAGINLAGGVTVRYTVTGGSATNGVDFSLTTGTLTWAARQTSTTITVPTLSDALLEGDETVVVTLSDAGPDAGIGAPSTTTLTVRDATKPAQVRLGNDLLLCLPGCRSFTARLRAEEGYTWLAASGRFSAYQSVRHPRLSNFRGDAVGIPGTDVFFPGIFTVVPNRRYALIVTLDASGALVLVQIDEGVAPGMSAPSSLLATTAIARLGAVVGSMAPGAPRYELVPRLGVLAAGR